MSMPSASTLSKPPAGARTTRTGSGDRQIVGGVVLVFLVCAAVLASVSVIGTVRSSRAETALRGTLERVHTQQQQFRLLNQRFATWAELSTAGATLPRSQRVVISDADASHWFLSVRDRAAGVVCTSTGELFDEGPFERPPVCREERR